MSKLPVQLYVVQVYEGDGRMQNPAGAPCSSSLVANRRGWEKYNDSVFHVSYRAVPTVIVNHESSHSWVMMRREWYA